MPIDSKALFLWEHLLRAVPLVALAIWGVARGQPPGAKYVWWSVGVAAALYAAMGFDDSWSWLWILLALTATTLASSLTVQALTAHPDGSPLIPESWPDRHRVNVRRLLVFGCVWLLLTVPSTIGHLFALTRWILDEPHLNSPVETLDAVGDGVAAVVLLACLSAVPTLTLWLVAGPYRLLIPSSSHALQFVRAPRGWGVAVAIALLILSADAAASGRLLHFLVDAAKRSVAPGPLG